jgi:peptidoglycan/LPS O-acetylase OafA/YrhL
MSFNQAQSDYRADIDGLRAIAVISVVVFHAFPTVLPGGFVGVDIFFVISGYLITRIILNDMNNGTFTFGHFYSKRVRRLFPSLITVLISTYAFGWYFLSSQFTTLGKYVFGSALFGANYVAFSDVSYFQKDAISNPLLHLWSLGVEEQFYILWPVSLFFIKKVRVRVIHLCSLITAVSLILVYLSTSEAAIFYQPQYRLWELAVGAMLALFHHSTDLSRQDDSLAVVSKPHNESLSIFKVLNIRRLLMTTKPVWLLSGLTGIALSVFRVTFLMDIWNFQLLIPVLSTALVIGAGSGVFGSHKLLQGRYLVALGKISYPIYLWHWPIFSFGYLLRPNYTSTQNKLSLIALTLVFSILTYLFIEKPIRNLAHSRWIIALLSLVMVLIAVLGLTAWKTKWIPPRTLGADAVLLENYNYLAGLVDVPDVYNDDTQNQWAREVQLFTNNSSLCFQHYADLDFFKNNKTCVEFEETRNKRVLLLGDSHAAYLGATLHPKLESFGIQLKQFEVSSFACNALFIESLDSRCQYILDEIIRKAVVNGKPDLVVLFANYVSSSTPPALYLELAKEIKASGAKNVIVLGQMPLWNAPLPEILLRSYVLQGLNIPKRIPTEEPNSLSIDRELKTLFSNPPEGILYLSLTDLLCDESGCITMVGDNLRNDLIVWDKGHMTLNGSKFVSNYLIKSSEVTED